MAHPKRKTSKQRRDKRRTHKKLKLSPLAICPATGESHVYHRAHWYEKKLYYKGKIIIDNQEDKN